MIWNPADCSCLSCSQKGGQRIENSWLTLIPGKVNPDKTSSIHRKTLRRDPSEPAAVKPVSPRFLKVRTKWPFCLSKDISECQWVLGFAQGGLGEVTLFSLRMRGWLSGWRNPSLRHQETKKPRQHVESLEEEEECQAYSRRSDKAEQRDLWEIPSRDGNST